MYKYALLAAIALTGTLSISACSQQQDQSQQQPTEQAQTVTKPTDPNDTKAWSAYLGQIVQKNMQGMTADRPYPYLVPAGDSDDDQAKYQRQLEQVQDTVARGVQPGNMLVFAGPSSAKTAAFVGEVLPPAGCTRRLTSTPAAEERGSKAEIEFIERLWQTEMRR